MKVIEKMDPAMQATCVGSSNATISHPQQVRTLSRYFSGINSSWDKPISMLRQRMNR